MPAYLLTWDPGRWLKTEEEWLEDIVRLETLGSEEFARAKEPYWSMGTNFRQIQLHDRLFLYRQRSEPRGIFASGYATSEPFTAPHCTHLWQARPAGFEPATRGLEVRPRLLADVRPIAVCNAVEPQRPGHTSAHARGSLGKNHALTVRAGQ